MHLNASRADRACCVRRAALSLCGAPRKARHSDATAVAAAPEAALRCRGAAGVVICGVQQ